MRREDCNQTLIEIYEKNVQGIEVFKIKPWEVQLGQTLKFRDLDTLQKLHDAGYLYEPLTNIIKKNIGLRLVVDEDILKQVNSNRRDIFKLSKSALALTMFELDMEVQQQPTQEAKLEQHVYSIRKQEKDPDILKEMKDKVDKKRLKQLLSIAGTSCDYKVVASNETVDTYLDIWANAKYEYYLMFGHNLTLSTTIESVMDEKEMSDLVNGLKMEYPQFALNLSELEIKDFIENNIHYVNSKMARTFGSKIQRGMKLSKFCSQTFKSTEFDIALSEVMQNKLVKGNLHVSIDPYDYLTSSINQHDWRSCHRINDGEYGTGSVSYLLDDTTLMAIKENGKEYDYNMFNFKFKGNSKTYRQCVYFDKDSCSIIFGRQYPNDNTDLAKKFRMLLEQKVCEYVGCEDKWVVKRKEYEGKYKDVCTLHYSDVRNDYGFMFAKLKDSKPNVAKWNVGYKVPCIKCGSEVTHSGENCLCDDCDNE